MQLVKITPADKIDSLFPEDCIQALHWNIHIAILQKSVRSIVVPQGGYLTSP
jgi:hypothetical protein